MASKNDDRAQQLLQLQQTVADAQLALAEALRALSQGQAVGAAVSREIPTTLPDLPHRGPLKFAPVEGRGDELHIDEGALGQLVLADLPSRADEEGIDGKVVRLTFKLLGSAGLTAQGTGRATELNPKLDALVALLREHADFEILGDAQCPRA